MRSGTEQTALHRHALRWILPAIIAFVAPSTVLADDVKPRSESRLAPAPLAGPQSSLSIVDIEPDPNTPLKAGERIKLRITIRYVLEYDEANLDLAVQVGNNEPFVKHHETASQGSETRIWTVEFKVPRSQEFDVIVTMFAPGHGFIGMEDRPYRVGSD